VKASGAEGKTSAISRDHVIHVDTSGLLTITGGKWTTYRHMAEDCVDHAITLGRLRDEECKTKHLRIHGYVDPASVQSFADNPLQVYGSDAEQIRALAQDPALAQKLHPELPYIAAEVVWATRSEMARSIEDVLARRTRALFLNARAAMQMARPVARLMATQLQRDEAWMIAQVKEFCELARQYTV
jgi:glycerol-3-phosphate dehydrogenase